ncbi:MAG: hypothetical protein HZY76_02060 [Anaerolineae bacterium]|nr:MAG: hypothetical protein HZY76_02060 [Anaerolineae bacterium]
MLNVAIIDSPRDVAQWIRLRLFPGVPWQKSNYALDSNAAAYLYAYLLHPLRILGGFAARRAPAAARQNMGPSTLLPRKCIIFFAALNLTYDREAGIIRRR